MATYNQPDVAIAYLYCDYKEENQLAGDLFSALIRQLVEQLTTIPIEVKEFHKFHNSRPNLAKKAADCSTRSLRALLSSVSALFTSTFVIIDALDECPELDCQGLRNRDLFFSELREILPSVKLLVTSRLHQDIDRYFGQYPRIDIYAHTGDVQSDIESSIEIHPSLLSFVSRDPSLTQSISRVVSHKAGGMYSHSSIRCLLYDPKVTQVSSGTHAIRPTWEPNIDQECSKSIRHDA